jgi:hypothetical protein
MYLESKGIDLGALGKAENKKEELGIQIREMGLSVNEQIDIYTAAENMDIILAEEKKRAEKEILISRENILLSIFPSKELGTVLDSLRESIKNMQTFNLENIAEGIVDIIKNDGKTQIQEGLSDEDLSAILIQLLRDTVKTEVRNFIRNFEIQTKKAVGYKVMARDKQSELETTELTKEELTEKIETILGNFESGFTTGDKSLDEGVLSSLKQQSKELSSNN